MHAESDFLPDPQPRMEGGSYPHKRDPSAFLPGASEKAMQPGQTHGFPVGRDPSYVCVQPMRSMLWESEDKRVCIKVGDSTPPLSKEKSVPALASSFFFLRESKGGPPNRTPKHTNPKRPPSKYCAFVFCRREATDLSHRPSWLGHDHLQKLGLHSAMRVHCLVISVSPMGPQD